MAIVMRAPHLLAVVLIAWPASVSGFEPAERYVTTPAPCLRHAEEPAAGGGSESTLTPGRLLAKRACSAVVRALSDLMPGAMARYDEDWSPRAFRDNLTAWGTPVFLIERGGLPPGRNFSDLTRLNFVALLTLLRNESDSWSEVTIRGGFLLQPGTTTPYRADLSFDLLRDDRHVVGCAVEDDGRSRLEGAQALARRLAGPRRARLEPVGSTSSLPSVTLSAPPPALESRVLASVLLNLGGGVWWQRTEGLPPVRRGQPAPEGRIDLADARLAEVWLDGYEVGVSP